MLFNDFGHIFGLNLSVPNALGINQNRYANRAKADRAAVGKDNLAHWIPALRFFTLTEPLRFQNAFEFGFDFGRADLRAGLTVTDKNVPFKGRVQDGREFFELLAVLNYLFLCHCDYCATSGREMASKAF